ncbi:MAG: NAD+ synthase [Bacteroidetes bacterium]|nr:NAD+ synthase [Bacteroidota bacterium]
MKITLGQINPHPGNIEANTRLITRLIGEASGTGSHLVVFPEMCVTGYPPMDLLDSPAFIARVSAAVEEIASSCTGTAAIIGAPVPNLNPRGKRLYNTALLLRGGRVEKAFHKALLPTYDIFDEYRWFEPGSKFEVFNLQGTTVAVTTCEDLWDEQPFDHMEGNASLYNVSPMEELAKLHPHLVINISASPFAWNRIEARERLFSYKASKYHVPVIMVNQCGANTDLLFDGSSLVIDSRGRIRHRLARFREDTFTIDTATLSNDTFTPPGNLPGKITLIHDALICGLRDYLAKTGQKKVALGLSGGIDSAVCAAIATEAAGPENVAGILMPSHFSSQHSVDDALLLARNLGIHTETLHIGQPIQGFEEVLSGLFAGTQPGIAEENIQARIRAILLMAFSNKFGYLVLNTSNKSEAATGYGTLYGDMAGALAVLGDVYKTDIYRLAKHINREREIIPVNSITKPPSAELRENQLDTDSLPPYEVLDEILFRYIELIKDPAAITGEGFDASTVKRVIAMVDACEYKRYQAPPPLRVSTKAFGGGRRIPLVSGFRH